MVGRMDAGNARGMNACASARAVLEQKPEIIAHECRENCTVREHSHLITEESQWELRWKGATVALTFSCPGPCCAC